ncbi:MAG: acyltransferase [Paracoccaceae bacterium]
MKRIECLDGLRGIAALWVLVGHCMLLTGYSLPLLGNPDLGVDLFILLSGFLMTWQYQIRSAREDWRRPATWVGFWVRRYFRISPLYYVLLIVALLAGGAIYDERSVIDAFLGRAPQQAQRYLDDSAANLALHLTYLFGFLPDYAYRTPLPDWSLGLEMQFYLAFPFLVMTVRHLGWTGGVALLALIGAGLAVALQLAGVRFPMPTFLPLKLHLFLAGMLMAWSGAGARGAAFPLALVLAVLPIGGAQGLAHGAVRAAMLTVFFALVHWRHLVGVDRAAAGLGNRFFHWMGELSFGVYLIHLLVLHPVAAGLIRAHADGISPGTRFAVAFLLTAAVSYGLAYAGYRLIELPGQALGRRVQRGLARRLAPVVEEPAVPVQTGP